MKIISAIYSTSAKIFWKILFKIDLFFYRLSLRNKNFTILSNDCIAGHIYNQYGIPYKTPTTWISFSSIDFLNLCNNLDDYINKGKLIKNVKDENYVTFDLLVDNGDLPPIKLNYIHHKDYDYVEEIWERRKKRINWNNIFVVFNITDYPFISNKDIEGFLKLPYRKILFYEEECLVDLSMVDDKFEIVFGKRHLPGMICWRTPNRSGTHFNKRYFNNFNFTKWLNKKI